MKITATRLSELMDMAKGLYLTIMGLTTSPAEFVNVLGMLHLILWQSHHEEGANVDTMLADYCSNFKDNLADNEKIRKQEMN